MKLNEEKQLVDTLQFCKAIKNTHHKMTETFKNKLIINVNKLFPSKIMIEKSLFKRIINNFISNSLKHTTNGIVEITLNIIRPVIINTFGE